MFCPVIYFDLSDERNTATSAISSGVPIRSIDKFCIKLFFSSSLILVIISVLIMPGEMEFTRIPLGPSSLDSALVNPIRPALEAE